MNIYPGMRVEDAGELVGFVREVAADPRTGAVVVVVRGADGQLIRLDGQRWAIDGDVLRLEAGERPAAAIRESDQPARDPRETQVILPSQAELRAEAGSLAPGGELTIPVVEEQAVLRTRAVEGGGVRVRKTVSERQELVEQPVVREEIDVRRVPVNQVVAAAPPIREEGDVTIIPVVEEVLVVEKRLLLKEEIHLVRRRVEETRQAEVTLRREDVAIERIEPGEERAAGA
ncbi:MAG TPA: YsnF/AvaK domain-containing protein [Herpetosiphonaceae bacterium]